MRVIKVNKTTLVQNNNTNLDYNNNNLLLNIAHSPEYAQSALHEIYYFTI